MNLISVITMFIVGVIHIIPGIGVLGNEKLNELYGVHIADPNLAILMKHRAVLFAIIGLLIIAGSFKTSLYWISWTVGITSVIAFLFLAHEQQNYNHFIAKIYLIDWVCVFLLIISIIAKYFGNAKG